MADGEAMDAASKAAMVGFLHEFDLSTDTRMTPVEEVFENNAPHNGLLLCESVAERTKLKANERRDRYRKKLRDERETLRLQERELSAKLSRLQEADAKAKEEEKKMNTLALSSWRATALRQKEKRLEAEYLQQQLKAAVRYRSELISHMNALLMKPVLTTDLTCENHLSHRETQGALLFKAFVGELDSLYAKTDDHLKGDVELSTPETFELKLRWNQDQTLLESSGSAEIPATFDQVWRLVSSISLSDPRGTHCSVGSSANTTATTYRLTYTLDCGDTATLVFYCVLRRYVETDRVVFVWRTLTEGQGEFNHLYSNEHAWLVIRPSASLSPATKLQTYTRLKPMRLNGQPASMDTRGNRFVKFLVKADDEDVVYMQQAVQQMLETVGT